MLKMKLLLRFILHMVAPFCHRATQEKKKSCIAAKSWLWQSRNYDNKSETDLKSNNLKSQNDDKLSHKHDILSNSFDFLMS